MKLKLLFFLCISLFTFSKVFAQQDSLALRTQSIAKVDSIQGNFKEYNPLAPAKAAFFSAIFPGLGQIYNGSYWKLPIVYGALGTSVYFYIENDKQYNRYRDAYKRRLEWQSQVGRVDEASVRPGPAEIDGHHVVLSIALL